MTTATRAETLKTEAETVTKDGVASPQSIRCRRRIATGHGYDRKGRQWVIVRMDRSPRRPMTNSVVAARMTEFNLCMAQNRVAVPNSPSPDAGWDALAKTRAFYATERFETPPPTRGDGDGRTNGKRANRDNLVLPQNDSHVPLGNIVDAISDSV